MIELEATAKDLHEINQSIELNKYWKSKNEDKYFSHTVLWKLYYYTFPYFDINAIKDNVFELLKIKFKREGIAKELLELYNPISKTLYRNLIKSEFENSYRAYLLLQTHLDLFEIKIFSDEDNIKKHFNEYLHHILHKTGDHLLNINSKNQRFNYLIEKLKGQSSRLSKTKQSKMYLQILTEDELNEIDANNDIKRECKNRIYRYFYEAYLALDTKVHNDFQNFIKSNKLDKDFYFQILSLLKTSNYLMLDEYSGFNTAQIPEYLSYHFYKLFEEKLSNYLKIVFPDFADFNINKNLKLALNPIEIIELAEALIQTNRINGHNNKDELYKYICKVFNYDYKNIKNHPTLSTSKVKAKYTNPNSKSRFLKRLMNDFETKCKD